MRVEITGSPQAITEAELKQFEDNLKARLPEDYRNFLLMHNGGKPTPDIFDVDLDGFQNTSSVQHLLSLANNDYYSFGKYLEVYKGRIPINLLPIAKELSVDLICLSVSGEDYGCVYYWDHNWEQEPPDYTNVHFLANSFSDFLQMLYDDEIEI